VSLEPSRPLRVSLTPLINPLTNYHIPQARARRFESPCGLFTPPTAVWSRDDRPLDRSPRYWQERNGHKDEWIKYGAMRLLQLSGHAVHAHSGERCRGSRPISVAFNRSRTSNLRAEVISRGFWNFQQALGVLAGLQARLQVGFGGPWPGRHLRFIFGI
jgi:hypothetical protein